MMNGLFDLIFSNIWILFILLWVFRSFAKGFKQVMNEQRESPRPIAPIPLDIPWEANVKPPMNPKLANPEPSIGKSVSDALEQVAPPVKEYGKERLPDKGPSSPKQTAMIPSPVEGMMWSQIFGPPRAKNPHYTRK